MLDLNVVFDLQRDVIPWIVESGLIAIKEKDNFETLEPKVQIVNVERNGSVLYTWKGKQGNTSIGIYDLPSKQNKLLYTFEKEQQVISCSVNKERTLLAVSYLPSTNGDTIYDHLRPVPKCLTLLIEIRPINNMNVLKAVDSRVRVQFLYPVSERNTYPESHLLLVSEDQYIEHVHIRVFIEEGYRVVVQNPGRFPKEKLTEDFIWAQWDMQEQRLFFIITKTAESILKCIQFYPDKNFELVLEVPLGISVTFPALRLVNFGHDPYQEQATPPRSGAVRVCASKGGSMCICYSQPIEAEEDVTYSLAFIHQGFSKTFTVSLKDIELPCLKELLFIDLDRYIAVYLPKCFLHLINKQHPKWMCHSLFLSGKHARIHLLNTTSSLYLPEGLLLDLQSGKLFDASINQSSLLTFLRCTQLDYHRVAALHCALDLNSSTDDITHIIDWICDSAPSGTFDPIQEFILAFLYRTTSLELKNLDKLLPFSSLSNLEGGIPGVMCVTDLIPQPAFKVQNLTGFWEEMYSTIEAFKYLNAEPHFHCNNLIREEWKKVLKEMNSEEKPCNYLRTILEHAKKVISMVDTWGSEQRVVPLFQEEDYRQRVLIGLIVEKLKDHLMRHLQRVGKKKIDILVIGYVARLLELIRQIMETVWRKYSLDSRIFSFKERGSAAEFAGFHMMSRILEATNGLCLPLPPGFQTLHTVLGVHCLPLHTLLLYIDHDILHLTEPFVVKLLKDLDNTETNEQLKFSIVARLPECYGTSMRDKSPFSPEFLPLNYLTKILTDVEDQALNPFEEQENVDARFVEEIALKQTLILLGLENQ
ncbi:gamma-secretase-activating protein isoform X3 [Latimeria chalumnae]|uniref:gamma-secretase-activating protein isoform X3 n=1 Tax=Latimeria chalumnae TaxID=7897 RepID=UPI00313AF1C2